MTRARAFSAVALLLMSIGMVAVASARGVDAQAGAVSLPDAIDQGLVRAEFLGEGGASGAVIRLQVTRAATMDLTITVPRGLLLRNRNPEEQDMTVQGLLAERTGDRTVPVAMIDLRDDDTHTYVLEAYCLEAELENPSVDAVFVPEGFVGPDLIAVLDAVDQVPDAEDEIDVIQAAVWVLTDDITREKLAEIGYELSDADVALV
ncbi:MAG: hypothetical protein ACRDJE_14950, partial [Dehalococcoidia bacterium]